MVAAYRSRFAALSRAAGRFAAAVVRRAGASAVHPDWARRATVCERCPMRVVAGNVSYCGQPFHRKPVRDDAQDGCGCPTRDKARSPDEHCPLTARNQAAPSGVYPCECKWCAGELIRPCGV
jgi:hypothetical protein